MADPGNERFHKMDPKLRKSSDAEFLRWMADRLVHVYKESPNVDFVLKLRAIAASNLLNGITDHEA